MTYTKWGLNGLWTLGLAEGKPDILRTFECRLDKTAPIDSKFQPSREFLQPSKMSITDACRATTAAPTYFRSQKIDGIKLIDGGVGSNNPTRRAWKEVESQMRSGGRRILGYECPIIVSIGTGLKKGKGNPITDTEAVHHRMQNENIQNIPEDHYFRFNVENPSLHEIKMDSEDAKKRELLARMTRLVESEFGTGSENTQNRARMELLARRIVQIRRERRMGPDQLRWDRFTNCSWYKCPQQSGQPQKFGNDKDFKHLFWNETEWDDHLRSHHPDSRARDEILYEVIPPHYRNNGVEGPW